MASAHLRRLIKFLIIVGLTSLIACSSSGKKGMGNGDGDISDADLALGARDFGDGNIPKAQAGGVFADVFFEFDSSSLSSQDRDRLVRDAQVLIKDPALHVEVEGHCDKRGTNEYNLALGESRAKTVASILVSAGVSPSRVSTISYGEEIPLDPADSETAYAKNRRAHFAVFKK